MTHSPLDALLRTHCVEPLVPTTPADPSFSIIIRTQGHRPRTLREAIASVQAQTYDRFELIIVVHNEREVYESVAEKLSVDESLHLGQSSETGEMQEVAEKLSVDESLSSETTHVLVLNAQGGSRARPLNVGLDVASGDYVCFLDDDDLAEPNWLIAFKKAANQAPGTIIRAVTQSQNWTTEGTEEPVKATGEIEMPFARSFDLLAHMSKNDTPICSIAVPRLAAKSFDMRFNESLPVFEDWEFLMRLAMLVGVTSTSEVTSLYRRLDFGNADTLHDQRTWEQAHAAVINLLSDRPVLLPAGDARRIASSHYSHNGESRHSDELREARVELDVLTRSPWRWLQAFSSRAFKAIANRIHRFKTATTNRIHRFKTATTNRIHR